MGFTHVLGVSSGINAAPVEAVPINAVLLDQLELNSSAKMQPACKLRQCVGVSM